MIVWLVDHWRLVAGVGGGATLIALILGAVFAPLATLGLLREIVRFFIDRGTRMWRWLRKPGSFKRLLFWLVIFALVVAVFYSFQKNQQYTIVVEQRDTAVAERRKAEDTLASERKTWKQQQDTFADLQRRQTKALEQAQRASAGAVQEFKRKQAAAARSNGAWWRVYEDRSDTCKAAQEALDVACKDVGEL